MYVWWVTIAKEFEEIQSNNPMTNASLRNLKAEADEKKRLELIKELFNRSYLSIISSATAGDTKVSIPLAIREPHVHQHYQQGNTLEWYEANFPFIADKLYASFPEASIQLQIWTFQYGDSKKNTISLAELSTIRKLGSTGIVPELSVLVDWTEDETGV